MEIGELCLDDCQSLEAIEIETYTWSDQKGMQNVMRLRELIESATDFAARIRLDIGGGHIEIPIEFRELLHNGRNIYTSSKSVIVPLDISVIDIHDFHSVATRSKSSRNLYFVMILAAH